MVWCSRTGEWIAARGRRGAVRLRTDEWRPAAAGTTPTLPVPVETALHGQATRLSVPGLPASLSGPGGDRPASGLTRLQEAEWLVTRAGTVEAVVRFEGPARVHPPTLADGGRSAGPAASAVDGPNSEGTTVSFDGATPVTIGFREAPPDPPVVTVPPTPEGVATAVTHAASALGTLGPERSHPDERGHPPLVELGGTDVPGAVRRATPESGIEFRIPPSTTMACLAAPLAFYLGASVHIDDDRSRPLLHAPGTGVHHPFRAGAGGFADEAAELLRSVFHLDCLVRDRPGERLSGGATLERLSLDAARLRALSPAERLSTYLAAPLDRVEMPAWSLATYVDGDARTVRCLPHLLDRLSVCYPAAASELDGESLLHRALDGFYRGADAPAGKGADGTAVTDHNVPPAVQHGNATPRSAGDVATADRLDPELRNARLHGWLAEGTPIEAFKSTPQAYRNRLRAGSPCDGPLDIAVVCNDADLTAERAVADIYRERAADLPVDVQVHESMSRLALADLLETPHDFVHYIGHCERDGLRCRDGYLDAADLETVRARTFFLNACGSYQQGHRLVQGGSVAGAVTLTTVLDRDAAAVGTAFASLLIHGAGVERALSLARQEVLMGSDYAVVGDGTYAPVPTADPAVLYVSETSDSFAVVHEVLSAGSPGRSYASPFGAGDLVAGTDARVELGRAELVRLLRERSLPTRFEGCLRWSTELARELSTASST
jgi:hypothetical protein